ncbi:hypothetical protein BC833DRAFT_306305 [Globomyces pollinis-pini]|nr:hypothetical protein BC833DRAFT_306305 [Globomyces pollinis-pini]
MSNLIIETKMNESEKIRQRKIRHSQIEKKRRERISKCLQRLVELVPKNRESTNNLNLGTFQILSNTIEYLQNIQLELNLNESNRKLRDTDHPMNISNLIIFN